MTFGRLKENEGLWTRLRKLALTDVGALVRKLNASDLEAMERLLIESDFGVPATLELVEALESDWRKGKLKNAVGIIAVGLEGIGSNKVDEHVFMRYGNTRILRLNGAGYSNNGFIVPATAEVKACNGKQPDP